MGIARTEDAICAPRAGVIALTATSIRAAGTAFSVNFKPVWLRTYLPGPLNQPHFLTVGPNLRPEDGFEVPPLFFLRRAILDSAAVRLVYGVAHIELANGGRAGIGGDVGVDCVWSIDNKIRCVWSCFAGTRTHRSRVVAVYWVNSIHTR